MVLARHRTTSLWKTKSSIPNMQNSFRSLFQGRRLKMCNNLLKIPQWTLWKTSQVQQSWFHHLFTNLSYENFSNQAFLHVHVFDCHVNYLIFFKSGCSVCLAIGFYTLLLLTSTEVLLVRITHTAMEPRYFMTKHRHISYSALTQYSLLQNDSVKRQHTQV